MSTRSLENLLPKFMMDGNTTLSATSSGQITNTAMYMPLINTIFVYFDDPRVRLSETPDWRITQCG